VPLELISFKTCPFVQRAAITLAYKNVAHKVTFIDLADPPDWFLEISPLQKVPLLRVDDEVLFESAVINEYLDDITGAELQPRDSLARAKNRSWIEVSSNMLGNHYMMKMASNQESYEKYRNRLKQQMKHLEKRLDDGPWFNGEYFSLADTAFAPLFVHDAVANYRISIIDPKTMPKVDAWSKRLMSLPAVKNSVIPEFEALFLAALEKANTFSWSRIAA
jgi:glutathione S-transferase